MGRLGIDDLEDLSSARPDAAGRTELLRAQTECTFCFNLDGWPAGVVVSYQWHEGSFWFTAVDSRRHIKALADDDRVSLVVTNAGTELPGRRMVSIRGHAIVHRDRETLEVFLERFSAHLTGDAKDSFIRLLDSPGRVCVEIKPAAVHASHDSTLIPGDGRGGQG